jgi:hypothetical protein
MVKKLKCKKDGKMHEVWRGCVRKDCPFLQAGIDTRGWYQLNVKKANCWDFIKQELKPILFRCAYGKKKNRKDH